MGYGYDPEETTGQEHMDDTVPESGGQEYTDSAQKTDASDMSAYSGVSDDISAYSSGSTGAADNAQNASDNTQDTFNSASDADQGTQPSHSRYEYQNYYNDRYRGDDSKQKYGYQPGVPQTPAPKKRDSAGKWIAVSALVVIFVCVCIGIGLIGVYSIRSANQMDSASVGVLEVAPDAGDDAKNQEDDGDHAATDSSERSEAKYAKAEVNVDKICKVLEGHQIQLLKDAAMLDQMYQLNLTYYKELSMYILAGKEKIQQVKEQELPELIKRAEESGLPEDTQKAKDLAELCNRFEKKIYDLELTRTISMQMAPQIRLIQSNDTAMSEKIQSTLVNTIPLWKSQMVLAIGVEHSAQAAKAQREVTDMTNTLLKKNAETLKLATVETAKESERGIVDIETLKQTNETLISTLDEVLQIQEDGRNKRREAEAELTQIETTMRNKLMEMSRTK